MISVAGCGRSSAEIGMKAPRSTGAIFLAGVVALYHNPTIG